MLKVNNDLVSLLLKEIKQKTGYEIKTGRDCSSLSLQIMQETNRSVSNTTLKRIFGIIQSSVNPSQYILDTLAVFVGYQDWESFAKTAESSQNSHPNGASWQDIKQPLLRVTENSMKSLKLKTGYDPEKFILRAEAREKFERFELSSQTAMMFVSPDGYGKSSTLLQLVEEYFLRNNAKYKDDVLCVIDGAIFFNLYANNSDIELLNQLIDFKLTSSLAYFFRQNPDQRKGRVWIFIDDVDEIFVNKKSQQGFAENLMRFIISYNENPWTKIMLTCRPENLDVFSSLAQKNPLFRSCWTGVNFSANNTMEAINIPVFSEHEIKNLLEKLNFPHPLEHLKVYHNDVLDVVQQPNFLSILTEVYEDKGSISKVVLLDRFTGKRLHSQPYREEKDLLIDRFFKLCDYGRENTSVRKDFLPFDGNEPGYKELISHGLIYEYTQPDDGIFNHFIYVKFCQNIIFEFVLLSQWLRGKLLDISLIHKMQNFYSGNEQLLCRLMTLISKILLHNNDFQTIAWLHTDAEKSIGMPVESIKQIPKCTVAMSDVIRKSMRYNRESREFLIPLLAKTQIGQKLYFEEAFDIDGIVIASGEVLSAYRNKKQPQSDAFTHFMFFMQGFLTQNHKQCQSEFQKLMDIEWHKITNPEILSYFYNVQIIYNSYYDKEPINHLVPRIAEQSEKLLADNLQTKESLAEFEFLIITVLNMCERYDEVIELSQIISYRYDFSMVEGSPFYQYYQLCLGRALLHKKSTQKALEIFDSIVDLHFPDHMKFFMKINVNLISIDFFLHRGQQTKAIDLTEEILHYARVLKFNFFIEKVPELKERIDEVLLGN